MTVPVARRITRWACPMCHRTDVTHEPEPHSRLHQCPNLRGAWAPFVQEGTRATLIVDEREDYVGKELVTCDGNGRPVTAVRTVRDDGQDCHVFAPCAVINSKAEGA